MTLETIAHGAMLLSIPLGFAVEYLALSRHLFGPAAGAEPSVLRLLWLASASVVLFKAASWIWAELVPRDPSLLLGHGAYFFVACMGIGFAYYAAREAGRLWRERGS